MTVGIFDTIFNQLESESPPKEDLLKMILTLKKTVLYGVNTHSSFDIMLKISESKHSDDDIVLSCARYIDSSHGKIMFVHKLYLIFNNGSKQLFDDVWEYGLQNKDVKQLIWQSKYCSEKQLEELYKLFKVNSYGHEIAARKRLFFKHPNAPEKILNQNAKTDTNLIEMAKNPNLEKYNKIFSIICEKCKDWKNRTMNADDMLEALLNNESLNWNNVANGIDLENYISRILSDNSMISTQRIEAILKFCKNEKCPEKLKGYLFEKTGD